MNNYLTYWGKVAPVDSAALAEWHALVCHALDVAAVGHVLLHTNRHLQRAMAELFEGDAEQLIEWVVFFLALHDVGKFSESFQNLHPDLLYSLQGVKSQKGYGLRHDSLGYLLWRMEMESLVVELLTGETMRAGVRRSRSHPFGMWASAVTGHHGLPPQMKGSDSYDGHRLFSDRDRQAARSFVQDLAALLLTGSRELPSDAHARFKRSSWWLAGVVVVADWLGSSRSHFPFQERVESLSEYWQQTLSRAEKAVRDAGLLATGSRSMQPFSTLFPALGESSPTPMQQAAAQVELGQGARLFILEDQTGAGKTEAAMLLVHRLLAQGDAAGFYLALPTMATANAMYERLAPFYRRLFQEVPPPSLVLAHGARDLSMQFRQSLCAGVEANGSLECDEVGEAGAHCVAWMADSRKKALLAQAGVGTIDQALLSVLESRHQALRLVGLFGKVLVVDEVHANDAYMHRILRTLLEFHAASGGSAILLSATLPQSMRQELVNGFVTGMDTSVPAPKLNQRAYPLLTRVTRNEGVLEQAIAPRAGASRRVKVAWERERSEVVRRIVEAAGSGQAVCWVCNTVSDARAAYRDLLEWLSAERLTLFHARFAMGDRLAIEQRILNAFGATSTADQRCGRVVVATQVVEQSLDLDFDLLVSDLAPIDLLLQRAGRLRRHVRRRDGARGSGTDERAGEPTLWIHGPSPDGPVRVDWYAAVFPQGARVYEDHARLWLSARLLVDRGGFTVPDEARALIEGVYGTELHPVPEALEKSRDRAQAARYANSAQAGFSVVKRMEGYAPRSGDWWSEANTPTRLGEPESTLRLARWNEQSGTLTPWCAGSMPWELSQVKMRRCHAQAEAVWEDRLSAAVRALRQEWKDGGRWILMLPMMPESDGWWRGPVVNEAGKTVWLCYHACLGLLREEERA
ncbi:MAG: CRISPR-associated helicase Cas3' [Magnetococcales bacterium]|nr:CRISPR-associated helicase Cas3' [Magnetococcales bacterium]